jgi:hypothetical protein
VGTAGDGTNRQADEVRWEARTSDRAVIEVTGLALVGRGSNGADDEPAQVIPVAGDAEIASWSQLAIEVDGAELRVHDLGWANKALVVSLSGSVRRLKPFAGIALSDGDTIFFRGGRVQIRRVPASDAS